MASIAKLLIEISANTSKLNKSLDTAKSRISKFSKSAVKILKNVSVGLVAGAVAAVGAITAMVNKYAAQIDRLGKISSKLGITVASLQKLQYQAELTGVSAETMNMAMQRMVRRVSEAAKGTGAAKDALKELNINARELNQLSPDKQFYKISEAMKGIGNQGDKVRLAMKIFDTEGVSLVNTMSGNLEQMGAEFDTLGIKVSQSQAKMVEAYQDSKTKMGAIFSGFGIQLTAQLAEPFKMVVDWISTTITELGGMESAANKVALSMMQGMRGVVDVINDMLIGINKFELMSKKAALKGAEHKGAVTGGLATLTGGAFGDATNNQGRINQLKKEIEDLEKPIKSLKKIDDFIADMQRKVIAGSNKGDIETGTQIAREHSDALTRAANDADIMARSSSSAAEKTNNLANAATKATQAITSSSQVSQKAQIDTINFSDMSSRVKAQDIYSGSGGLSGLGAGLGGDSSGETKVKSMQDYIDASPAGKVLQDMRKGLAFGDNKPATSTTITLKMVTDAGEVAGQLTGDQAFIDKIARLQHKQTEEVARTAAQ